MSDFERRLAAALREAVAEARPPDRLTEMIRRRHRRHRVRVGAVSLAAVAAVALAVPLAVPVLTGGGPPAIGPASPSAPPPSPIPTVTTPPGPHPAGHGRRSVSEGCGWQIGGSYGGSWKRHSIHVGPVWIIDIRPADPTKDHGSRILFGNLAINVRDNAHVRIAVAGDARSYVRILYGDSGTGGRYTLRDGQLSVSLTGCRSGHEMGFYPGWTQFWGGYAIAKRPACVSLDIWTTAHQRPTRVCFPVGPINCGTLVTPPS